MGSSLDRDIRSLIELARHGSKSAFRSASLAGLGRLVGYDSAQFLPFDDQFTLVAPPHVRLFGSKRYQQGMDRIFTHTRGTYVDTLLFSRAERDRLPFFQELLRPTGITSTVVTAVHFRGRPTGVIHLYRHGGGHAFSRPEQDRIEPLLRCIGALHAALMPATLEGASPPGSPSGSRLLTVRERQIARLVGEGLRNEQIAARLGRSPHTVRHQLESIFVKCGVFNRTDLAVLVHRSPRLFHSSADEHQDMLAVIGRLEDTLRRRK
jgi:DNA-binding CsgD family transcriptional regulator